MGAICISVLLKSSKLCPVWLLIRNSDVLSSQVFPSLFASGQLILSILIPNVSSPDCKIESCVHISKQHPHFMMPATVSVYTWTSSWDAEKSISVKILPDDHGHFVLPRNISKNSLCAFMEHSYLCIYLFWNWSFFSENIFHLLHL